MACVRAAPEPERQPAEIATWDYTGVEVGVRLALWPASAGAPTRLKRQMETTAKNGQLEAVVTGPDPYFTWQFQSPVPARGVAIEADTDADGYFQVFWTTQACVNFNEACSSRVTYAAGPVSVQVVLPFDEPLRELRLDLLDTAGQKVVFRSIELLDQPISSTPWRSPSEAVTVESTPEGLVVGATRPDPWIESLGLSVDTSVTDTFEIDFTAPAASTAQLFWAGTECPHFAEDCSAVLSRTDGGAQVQSLYLRAHPRWRGTIHGLRFDPGENAATYVIRKVTLARRDP